MWVHNSYIVMFMQKRNVNVALGRHPLPPQFGKNEYQ